MKKVLFTATIDAHINSFHLPYLKLFKDNGYEVHVATNTDKEIPYCDVKHKISFERNPLKINNLKAIKKLKKIIDEEKFDIIHTHTPMASVVTRIAAIKSRKNGTRVIYTAHGFHFYKGAPLKNWLIFYSIEKILSRITDDIILINNEDYELAKNKFHAKRTHFVPGVGIDPKKFDFEFSEKDKQELRKSLGLKKSDFVMIYPAELNKNKNQIMLIEVMKELVKKNKNIKLLLPGKDSYNGKYQELVKKYKLENNIKFLGFRKDIPKLLRISNLAVSTSRREGLPVNLLEAMQVGLPIIATNCRGNRDLVIFGENGYIVEIDDIKDMKNKIFSIYRNKKILNLFGEKSKNIVKKYSVYNIIENINKIYKIKSSKKVDNIRKLLFVHGAEKAKEDNENNIYTDGSYPKNIWNDRYKFLANVISVIFRKENKIYRKEEASKKFQLLDKKVNFYKCEDSSKNIFSFFSIKMRKYNKKLVYEKVKENDIIIARIPCTISYYAIDAAIKYNKKLLVEVVGCPFDALWNHSIKGKIIAIPKYFELKKYIRKVKYAVYVTDKFLQNRYPSKAKSIGCSNVMLNNWNEEALSNRLAKINNKKENKYIFGIVGSLDINYKGHEVSIKALSLLKEKIDFELHCLGVGDKTRWVKLAQKYKIEDKVFFDGTLPSGKPVLEWLDNLDFHLIMSKQEGLPRILIEAMSRASVSIGSNVGGIPELIDEIIDKNDYVGLSKLILKLIGDKKLQSKIAKRNFEKSKIYKEENLNNKRKKFYNEFLNEEN